jgi:protein-tyrosine phosphatase
MSKITPQIWIGPFSKAWDEKFLKKHKITHIMCCAKEFNAPTFLHNDKTHWASLPIIDDISDAKTESQFRKGAAILNRWINAGHKVIVHCYAGISRSVSTVLAYLMIYKGLMYQQAYDLVKKGRPELNPHPVYVKILKGIEKRKTRKRRRV